MPYRLLFREVNYTLTVNVKTTILSKCMNSCLAELSSGEVTLSGRMIMARVFYLPKMKTL